MPLVNCPECKNQISTKADNCPNCGFVLPKIEPAIVKNNIVEVEPQEFPRWAIPVIAALALLIFFGFLYFITREDDNNKNLSVEVNAKTTPTPVRTITNNSVESEPVSQVSVPSNPSSPVIVNQPAPVSNPEPVVVQQSQQTVPSNPAETIQTPDPNKGNIKLDAKVMTKTGTQSVKNEKFYLLDEDLETILNKANLTPIENNSLTNSLGLSMMFPAKYGEFSRKAMEALKKHIKYSISTDANGKASIKDVKTDSYYLFGITKSKTGFAVWSSSVNINSGENMLNLAPAQFNEIQPVATNSSDKVKYDYDIYSKKSEDE